MLQSFATWLQSTWWGYTIHNSQWVYPFVQLAHFSGLSLWVGTCVTLDFHLLGWGRKTQTSAQLTDAMFLWTWIGLAVAIFGGVSMFSTNAVEFVENPAFLIKVGLLLPLGILWHLFVQHEARGSWNESPKAPMAGKIAAFLEITLWACVITGGCSIPYYAPPKVPVTHPPVTSQRFEPAMGSLRSTILYRA